MLYDTFIRKAVHGVQDLVDGAGYMPPVPARRFMRMGLPETELLRMMTMHPMSAPEEHVDKIRFATRILRAASTETALANVELATPQLAKQVLRAKLYKAEIQVPLETLEDNIEGEGYMQTLFDVAAPRLLLDIEELAVNGDTANAVDPYLASSDGLRKQADQYLYNHMGGAPNLDLWINTIRLMPPEYQRGLGGMKFFAPYNVQHAWRADLAGRVGGVGDAALQNLSSVSGFGIGIVPVYNMPDSLSYNGVSNHGDILLMQPQNAVFGIYSGIRVFLDLSVRDGVWSIIFRLRVDNKLVEKTAAVKARNVFCGPSNVRIGGSSTAELIPDDPVALSELGFSTTDESMGYADGLTSFMPPSGADLGITAPDLF